MAEAFDTDEVDKGLPLVGVVAAAGKALASGAAKVAGK